MAVAFSPTFPVWPDYFGHSILISGTLMDKIQKFERVRCYDVVEIVVLGLPAALMLRRRVDLLAASVHKLLEWISITRNHVGISGPY